MFLPENDGIDHINVYSRGKTELGRWLSNFQYCPITIPEHGNFNSIEGYWYWLSCKDDRLRKRHGFEAKRLGRELRGKDWVNCCKFKKHIKNALRIKLETSDMRRKELTDNTLPLTHYYVTKTGLIQVPDSKFIIDHLEHLRKKYALS